MGWISANWLPSGSSAAAIHPTSGTSCFGCVILPPIFSIFVRKSVMDSTEK